MHFQCPRATPPLLSLEFPSAGARDLSGAFRADSRSRSSQTRESCHPPRFPPPARLFVARRAAGYFAASSAFPHKTRFLFKRTRANPAQRRRATAGPKRRHRHRRIGLAEEPGVRPDAIQLARKSSPIPAVVPGPASRAAQRDGFSRSGGRYTSGALQRRAFGI